MKAIALDPGGTTGWATFSCIEMPNGELHEAKFACGQLGPEEHHNELYRLLELQHSAHDYTIVVESFEYRKGLRDNLVLMSREYIGVAKLYVKQHTLTMAVPPKFYMQTAATGKTFWTDEKLKKVGLYHPGWVHANDATRHLLWHLMERTAYRTELLQKLK